MNREPKKDLVRLLAGALLVAIRSERELLEVAEVLETDQRLLVDVAEALRGTIMATGVPPPKSGGNYDSPPDPLVDAAYQATQTKKMKKAHILEEVSSITSRIDISNVKTISTKEILRRFFANATPAEKARFLKRLDVGTSQDPYLHGIDDR